VGAPGWDAPRAGGVMFYSSQLHFTDSIDDVHMISVTKCNDKVSGSLPRTTCDVHSKDFIDRLIDRI